MTIDREVVQSDEDCWREARRAWRNVPGKEQVESGFTLGNSPAAIAVIAAYRHQIEANAREANKRHEDYLTATAYDCGWQAGIEEAADHADRWNTGIGESIRALKTDGG